MAKHLPLLIIGAGPYGLAMSAYARHKNIEHVVVGKTMEFWKSNMPNSMAACKELPNGELEVSLDGSTLVVVFCLHGSHPHFRTVDWIHARRVMNHRQPKRIAGAR